MSLERSLKEILKKKVSELTEEDKEILRKWLLEHRSRRSIAVDLRYGSKRVPVYASTWYAHQGKRYDIPGVDTPEALPHLEKLGYHPRTRKTKQSKENIEQVWSKLSKTIVEKMSKLFDTLKLLETMNKDIRYLDYEGKLKDSDIIYYRKQLEEIKKRVKDYENALSELKTNIVLLKSSPKYTGWYNDLKRTIPIWEKRLEIIKEFIHSIENFLDEKQKQKKKASSRTFADVIYNLEKATMETVYPFKVDRSKLLGDVIGWRGGISVARNIEHNNNWHVYEDNRTITVEKVSEPNMFDSVIIVKTKNGYDLYYHRFGTNYFKSPFVKSVKSRKKAIREAKKLLSSVFPSSTKRVG